MSPHLLLLLSSAFPSAAHAATGLSALSAGDLVITELMTNPSQVRASWGEWVEIHNRSTSTVDLKGLKVSGSGGSFTVGTTVEVAPGGYVVMAPNGSATNNGGLPRVDYVYSFTSFELGNRSGSLSLTYGTTTFDSVVYSIPLGFPAPWGLSMSLDADYINVTDNDSGDRWCGASTQYGDGDYGTPGAANDLCPVPLRDLSAGALVVTEFMPTPAGSAARYGEWIELTNRTGRAINLRGLLVSSSGDVGVTIANRMDLEAGAQLLLAASGGSSSNGGLPGANVVWGSAITLSDADSITIGDEDTVFDTVTWDASYTIFAGASLNLDVNHLDASSNDQRSVWCPGTDAYGSGDNYGTPKADNIVCLVDMDGDGVTIANDCDDTDPEVHPFAIEVCDGIDNNCDGSVDEGVTTTYYADADGDGYGLSSSPVEACAQPSGYAARESDCNDADAAISPAALEVCDDQDNDCDGLTDEMVKPLSYRDADGDGYGDAAISIRECTPPSGYVYDDNDCDDTEPRSFPGNEEVCDDIDNDCDGRTDELVKPAYYIDADGDGYGDPSTGENACVQPEGTVLDKTDCDDTSAEVNPTAAEVCDDLDNDCDGSTDEGVLLTFYADADGDGYGNRYAAEQACAPSAGYVDNRADCYDASAAVYPGAEEVCDELDNDCDGTIDEDTGQTWYADLDADGYGDPEISMVACAQPEDHVADATDCDDNAEAVYPGAPEVCDAADNDCDGSVDEDALDALTWHPDADGDGYGDPAASIEACEAPAGHVEDATDCDDAIATAYPDAEEVCDGIDNDCNGSIDEGLDQVWYADADGDGFGDPAVSITACAQPQGYVANADDCNDSSTDAWPGAEELCDGLDNDCDGDIDEDVLLTFYADVDADGYGDAGALIEACEAPEGFVADDTDCDDTLSSVNPGMEEVCDELDNDCDDSIDEDAALTWYADLDRDRYGDGAFDLESCAPVSIFDTLDDQDCDDRKASIHPDAEEVCDQVDNDCDTLIDEELTVTFYEDDDGDGYGDVRDPIEACAQPTGFVDNADDCNDMERAIHPGAEEVCNGFDDDCDGDYDEGLTTTWYVDADGDGHGNPDVSIESCEQPDGFVAIGDDCSDCTAEEWDDSDGSCDLPADCDCDTDTDPDPEEELRSVTLCSAEDGLNVVLNSDGDYDHDAVLTWVHSAWSAQIPDAEWIWSSYLVTDPTVTATVSFGRDFSLPFDADILSASLAIAADNRYRVTLNGEEVAYDQDNANFKVADVWDVTEAMQDGDNSLIFDVTNVRSSLGSPYSNPAGLLYCLTVDYYGEEVLPDPDEDTGTPDEDEDTGVPDEDEDTGLPEEDEDTAAPDEDEDGDTGAPDEDEEVWTVLYADADGDGYGDAGMAVESPIPLPGFVTNGDDCDDADAAIHPGAEELCDDLDNDCDGLIDEGFASTGDYSAYYRDADGDGYGDAGDVMEACAQPPGWVDNGADPDDGDAATTPELCDGYDNDGDGVVDEDLVSLSFGVDSFEAELLTLNGSAVLSTFGGESVLELTRPERSQRGSAMVAFPMPHDAWRVTFDFWTGGGTGADGLGLVIIDPEEKNLLGTVGGGLGVLGLEGYTVEFDTWRNTSYGDPNENHVAFVQNTDLHALAINTSIPELEDTGWFSVEIVAQDGEIVVHLDGEEVLRTDLPDDLPDNVMLGLAAATGAATNYHLIDDVSIGCPTIPVEDDEDEDEDEAPVDCIPAPWHRDVDGDGYGDPTSLMLACDPPAGHVADATDCNDAQASIYPGAPEACDSLDNDCDSEIDEGVKATWYADMDEDGYGDAASLVEGCAAPDGFVADDSDCDDVLASVNPGMEEACDELDNDCDDQVDEGATVTAWVDADQDGYGDRLLPVEVCAISGRESERDDDCDDMERAIHPDAEEVCDGHDNDCDSDIDEDVKTAWYTDADGDGYGDPAARVEACERPAGRVEDDSDCDDAQASVHPGAQEVCNGLDDDCDGDASESSIDRDGSGVSDCDEVVLVVSDVGARNNKAYTCEGQTNLDREVSAIESALDELGLSLVLVLEDEKVGVTHDMVASYPVVVYHNMGWAGSGALVTAEMLEDAAAAGQGLILLGDDVTKHAKSFSNRGTDALIEVAAISRHYNNGKRGVGMAPAATDHPVLDGAWGLVEAIPYVADIDEATTLDRGEEHLMYLDNSSYPGAWAEESATNRTVTVMASLYASHDCPISDEDGLENLRILFQNAVWWAGRY